MDFVKFKYEADFNTAVVELIIEASNAAIQKKGLFHIVLCGGTTPIATYKLLRLINTNWACWHFWLCDERISSENFEDFNRYVIENELLNFIPVPKNHVHFISIESEIGIAVEQYELEIKNVDTFDFCLLGIGEDGHTASLFPGNDCGENADAKNVLAIFNSPKPPKQRISISANRLNMSEMILFIASGEEKKSIIKRVLDGENLPCSLIKGKQKTVLFFTEK